MQNKFSKSNTITETRLTSGKIQYSVNLGTILYNNRFLDLNNMVIPFESYHMFSRPEENEKYIVLNIYYDAEVRLFHFDRVAVSDTYIASVSANAIPNMIPIGQFSIKEQDGNFVVKSYREYSQMSTFTISDEFVTGDTGLKGSPGLTGIQGFTGLRGRKGFTGAVGFTGHRGITGVGLQGLTGLQGETGVYPDEDLLLYLKFINLSDKQLDYSMYERDVYYVATGIYSEPGRPASNYTGIPGIVDNAHRISYGGGISMYRRYEYLEFGSETGTLSAWVKLTHKPKPNFSYEVDTDDSLLVRFTDESTDNPTSWLWWFNYDDTIENAVGGDTSTNQNPLYRFPTAGEYVVKLIVTNAGGSNEFFKFITVS